MSFTTEYLEATKQTKCRGGRFPDGPFEFDRYGTGFILDDFTGKIRKDTFSKMPDLEDLLVYTSKIESIEPGSFAPLKKLQRLFFNQCPEFPKLTKGMLDGADSVIDMEFFFCEVPEVESGFFKGMDNLGHLSIRGTKITKFDADVFEGLSALFSMELADNAIVDLDIEKMCRHLPKLRSLMIENTQIPKQRMDEILAFCKTKDIYVSHEKSDICICPCVCDNGCGDECE